MFCEGKKVLKKYFKNFKKRGKEGKREKREKREKGEGKKGERREKEGEKGREKQGRGKKGRKGGKGGKREKRGVKRKKGKKGKKKGGGETKKSPQGPREPCRRGSSSTVVSNLPHLAQKQPRNPTSREQNPPSGIKSPKIFCGKTPWRGEEGGQAGETAAVRPGIASRSPLHPHKSRATWAEGLAGAPRRP